MQELFLVNYWPDLLAIRGELFVVNYWLDMLAGTTKLTVCKKKLAYNSVSQNTLLVKNEIDLEGS